MFIYVFLIFSFLCQSILSDGFKEVEVLTNNGYLSIGAIKKGSKVASMSFDGNIEFKEVSSVIKACSRYFYYITVEDNRNKSEFVAKWGQKFILVRNYESDDKWTNVCDLKEGDELKTILGSVKITNIRRRCLEKRQKYYRIGVKDGNNFFVTRHNILVHNFAVAIPIFTWGGGQAAFVAVEALLSALSLTVLNSLLEKQDLRVPGIFNINQKTGMPSYSITGDFSSDDGNDPCNNSNRDFQAERKWDKEFLKKEGFNETKDYKFNSHGKKVYQKGNIQITRDRDCHKGGYWKKYMRGEDEREGTYNRDLTTKIGD